MDRRLTRAGTPLVYEVHTRQWLAELGVRTLADVPDGALDELAAIGATHLWLMGVWPTGPRARHQALTDAGLRTAYDEALPGWTDDDVAGSPYAVAAYTVAAELGGDPALAALRARLHARGLGVLLDFVPNHVGLDHPWVESEHVVAAREPFAESFAAGGRFVAHGKDPYFPAWTDTAQLDYRRAATRAALRDELLRIAARCDGVRCDMAMLVLPDVFERTWQHVPSPEPAAEFWADAIAHVKQAYPAFVFVAEAYWGLEARLCALGFDFAYDKALYDALDHGRPAAVADHRRCVHFLENHDEPRAAAAIPRELHRAAALLVLGLPGMRLVHHGQLAGARRFARIQLRRRAAEPGDGELRALYAELLRALAASSVGQGDARVLAPQPAWADNPTASAYVIVKWPADLVVINLAPHRAQCRVVVPDAPGAWRLVDRLASSTSGKSEFPAQERWDRTELDTAGLFLDLPARGAQLFALQRMT